MSYQKQNFANGEVLSAPQLNHIEDGIVDVESAVNETKGVVDKIIDPTLSVSGKAADAKAVGAIFDDVKTEKAEIDDSTVGLDAWSSKHIVDMLCPPLDETGNPVQCYPVAGYPLGCKVSWEPTQEGAGDPSPENVRPINGRDSVTVERCGENLLEFSETNDQSSNISIVVDQQKVVTLNGVFTAKGNVNIAKCRLHWRSGKMYTMRVKKISGTAVLGAGDGITYAFSLFSEDLTHLFRGSINSTSFDEYIVTDTPLEEVELILMLQCWRENTILNNYKFQVEVMEGSTPPTAYSPYTGQTSTLTLPHAIYGGTVDAVTGEGQETWKLMDRIDSRDYNEGSTTSGWTQSEDAVAWYVYEPDTFLAYTKVLSNVFLPIDGITYKLMPYTIGSGNGYISFRLPRSVAATKDDVKNWLINHGIQIAYQLKTPVPFTATGAQPTLALSGVNTALTDADSVTVTGRADPIKRITDLEDAVASMT